MKLKSGSANIGSGVISNSKSGVAGQFGVEGQLEVSMSETSGSNGSARTRNLLNSLPLGDGRCFEALMNGVPSGFLFLVRPGLPCFLDTPKTHCEPLAEQRTHIGCVFEHLTLEAAHASHEALSFGLRSCDFLGGVEGDDVGADVGADVGETIGGVVIPRPTVKGECHSELEFVEDIIGMVMSVKISGRIEPKI
jgi:hypothetical protein